MKVDEIKNIGLGYVNGKDSHSIVNSIYYHIGKIKQYESNGFEKLDKYNFYIFNLKLGKDRGIHRYKKDFNKLDKLYILRDDKSIISENIDYESNKDKISIVEIDFVNNIDSHNYSIPLNKLFLLRIFFDIRNNFKPLKNKTVYIYNTPDELLQKGDDAIFKIRIGDFEDFLHNQFCPYSYPKTFNNIKEVYEDALFELKNSVNRSEMIINSYKKSIKDMERVKETKLKNIETFEKILKEK